MSSEIEYQGARFYRCALQVNPCSYASTFQGKSELDEGEYNEGILQQCVENKIKIVGLADHGNVESSESLRTFLKENSIIVFPGFEIASSEKIHMVCLYPEDIQLSTLNQYLGELMGSHNTKLESEPTCPSSFSCLDISEKIFNQEGFWYAAHMTGTSGLLRLSGAGDNYTQIWKNDSVISGQIPGPVNNLQVDRDDPRKYREIIENKNPDYKRGKPIAIINAKDVCSPEILSNQSASCLIKMTEPTFASFKLAFHDPESRIRLNYDVPEQPYSIIKSISWYGAGFFEESSLAFSKHLNAIIGGRGTGKSTLIESIRYALDLPIRQSETKALDNFRKNTLNNSQIVLEITSKSLNDESYTISRRYGEMPVVKNKNGENSNMTPKDLLPGLELLGQNEILEIEKDEGEKLDLIHRFLPIGQGNNQRIPEAKRRLFTNRQKIIEAQKEFDALDGKVSREPKLKEQADQFTKLGIENKLKNIRLIEREKNIQSNVKDQLKVAQEWLDDYKGIFDLTFLEPANIDQLPNQEIITQIHAILEKLKQHLGQLVDSGKAQLNTAQNDYEKKLVVWNEKSSEITDELNQAIAKIPGQAGKSGAQLGSEYQDIVKQLTNIDKHKADYKRQKKIVNTLGVERDQLVEEYRQAAFDRFNEMNVAVKKLNKMLDDKLRINIRSKDNLAELEEFLRNIDGVGAGKTKWLKEIESPDLMQWAKWIEDKDSEAFINEYKTAGLTSSLANILTSLSLDKQLQLQEIELKDVVEIELNTSHAGSAPNFIPMENLSTGQKCTAILNLLLLSCDDPLIIDQPEDNLDNAFIAERIVQDLRKSKVTRQFLFATHNANIPVLGDAELITVLGGKYPDNQAIQHVGSIDKPEVRDQAAEILEGGQAAFDMRKNKYGF